MAAHGGGGSSHELPNINDLRQATGVAALTEDHSVGGTVAQKIMDALHTGPFSSWDNLKERVKGLGAEKLAHLQAKFDIRAVASAPEPTVFVAAEEHAHSGGHKDNINHRDLRGSAVLIDLVGVDTSLRIMDAKKLGGDFVDWNDMRRRVRGLGDAKIEALKTRFVVKPYAAHVATADHGEEIIEGEAFHLREEVTGWLDHAFSFRGDVDLYTTKAKAMVHNPEVDHVWEIQVLEHFYKELYAEGVAHRTRTRTTALEAGLKDAFNSLHNLNVTTHEVNQAKKGPFMKWLNTPTLALDEVPETSESRWLSTSGDGVCIWDNIKKAMKDTHEDFSSEDTLGMLGSRDRAPLEQMLDKMTDLLSKMGV